MTTVGYGDISPTTPNEKMFGMMSQLLAAGVYAYTINKVGKVISKYNVLSQQYRERMVYVNKFML